MKVAIQVATVVVMALKRTDTGPVTVINMANVGEVQGPRQSGPTLRQPAFDWTA